MRSLASQSLPNIKNSGKNSPNKNKVKKNKKLNAPTENIHQIDRKSIDISEAKDGGDLSVIDSIKSLQDGGKETLKRTADAGKGHLPPAAHQRSSS